ncbi:tetratricopeptide repeat protein [Sphaerospermopsis torques-reginae]|uniref:Tetratricopeptide repeat protein n=1 Tax=Sphaerospermopsis torques-reginae ITEP-024 TaxID=984208 RepID=A0ABX8WVB4_9CYAN|nr:tetratricopeptide repeat protein [Sphaerospermopsis torques-reginae]QYX30375.1 tetratricopeptide repeat protein [Sphaerospermopsis torques-reginae ITEP-024]
MAYKGRGLVYGEQKKWELALADYNQAIKINPDYSCWPTRVAVLFTVEQKKWELALADFNQAININPDYSYWLTWVAVLFTVQQQKWELALADYNQALKLNPDDSSGLQGSRTCLRMSSKNGN